MQHKSIKSRICSPFDLYQNEAAAWEKLSSTVDSLASPFLSLHYIRAVAETGMDVRVCIFYQDGVIRGFLPYQYRNHVYALVKAAEPVGAEMTDYFGLIADPEFKIASNQLLALAKINYFNFSHFDELQLNYGLQAEQPRTGLRIRLAANSDNPLAALCTTKLKYLKDTERRVRQLEHEIGPVEFSFDVQYDRQQHLDNLYSQKRAQYKRTKTHDALKHTWKYKLLFRLSEYRFETCRGVLSNLTAGNQWVASHFGIIGNGVMQYWLPVYNPVYAKYAPGRLLMHHIIQATGSASVHTIDRGEGDTPAKRELANEEHQLYRGIWHNKSMTSLAVRGFNSLRWRLGG
jgi:CelD/BcsL family acetyltransferase involved in cellulose biosynthesis